MIKISPSILSADLGNLNNEIKTLCECGADFIHVDVMDGHFVSNLTFGPPVIKAFKPYATVPLDVHLMVKDPERLIEDYIKAGADLITFHIESTSKPYEVINRVKNARCKIGIALMPQTKLQDINEFLTEIDLVLIMTVNPGFGGQEFLSNQIDKIKEIKQVSKGINKNLIISVDGGINESTSKLAVNSGANMLVAGSFLFNNKDNLKNNISYLKMLGQ